MSQIVFEGGVVYFIHGNITLFVKERVTFHQRLCYRTRFNHREMKVLLVLSHWILRLMGTGILTQLTSGGYKLERFNAKLN